MIVSAFRLDQDHKLVVSLHADDILDYGFDWADMFPAGDAIASSVWGGDGVTVTAPQQDGLITTAFIAAPTGAAPRFWNIVTTAGGRRKRLDVGVTVR